MLFGALAAATVAAAWWRSRYLRDLEAITRRRRLGPDGIVIGGDGFVLDRSNAPAILLLHGGGDTPQTLRYVGEALHERGFHIAAPLLPGHGRSLAEFSKVTAADLTNAARAEYEKLKASHEWVAIVGLSMGGALAVQLAAEDHSLPALGLLAPYLAMPAAIERVAAFADVWGRLIPVVHAGDGISVLDPSERQKSLAYGVFTAAALKALRDTMRRAVAALPRVTAPTLVMQSREDNRIGSADAERAFAALGARDKRFEWVTGCAHIITVDYGRDTVIARLAAFMESHAPPRAPTPSTTRVSR
jgi:carboxylesterase